MNNIINKTLKNKIYSIVVPLLLSVYVFFVLFFMIYKILHAQEVVNLVPAMEGNIDGGAEASDILNQTDAYTVFDGVTSTDTFHTIASSTMSDVWVQYKFATSTVVNGYKIYKGDTSPPTDFILEGSANESNWSNLDNQTGINWVSDNFHEFSISSNNVNTYDYYRLTVNDSTTTISEIEFYNYPVTISATGTMATSTNATSTDSDPDQIIKTNGAFTFKMTNNATTTINDLKIEQVGTLDVDSYVVNPTFKYATTTGPDSACPEHNESLEFFASTTDFSNGSTTISATEGVVINENPTCFYIEYDLANITDDFWFAGQSVDFEITDLNTSQKNNLIYEKNNIDGETVLVQEGVQTLTLQMSDDVNDLSKFYIEDNVLYIEKTAQERRRLTSRDVNVTAARFQKIDEYQVKVELVIEYSGSLQVGVPIREYFTTTVNMKKYDGTN